MHIRAGTLDRMIAVMRSDETIAANGEATRHWQTICTTKAQLVQADQSETVQPYGNTSDGTLIFRLRYRSAVRLSDRIVFEGNYYDIQAISEIGRRRGLLIKVKPATGTIQI